METGREKRCDLDGGFFLGGLIKEGKKESIYIAVSAAVRPLFGELGEEQKETVAFKINRAVSSLVFI